MMLNYHEMSMAEPRDSAARRQQFLVVCAIAAIALVYSTITSGIFVPVNITEATFPGGVFIYKLAQRDYAASLSLLESIGRDAGIKSTKTADIMYTLYLDDPALVKGRDQRFAAGYLASTAEQKKIGGNLVQLNSERKPLTKYEKLELGAIELWPRLPYETVELPKVPALVAHFPNTHGFVSALLQSYKVLPALRKYASEHNIKEIVIMTTCSRPEQMCTHYMPTEHIDTFHLDQMKPSKYAKLIGGAAPFGFDAKSAKRMLLHYVPPAKRFFNDEL